MLGFDGFGVDPVDPLYVEICELLEERGLLGRRERRVERKKVTLVGGLVASTESFVRREEGGRGHGGEEERGKGR